MNIFEKPCMLYIPLTLSFFRRINLAWRIVTRQDLRFYIDAPFLKNNGRPVKAVELLFSQKWP